MRSICTTQRLKHLATCLEAYMSQIGFELGDHEYGHTARVTPPSTRMFWPVM
jgi:hypothetical protein